VKVILISVILSIVASVIVTRFLTLRCFDVIDKYVKSLFDDIRSVIRQATRNE